MLNKIVVHHTGVSYEENPDQFNQTNEYHKKLWNFKSSLGLYGGYNYEISKTGVVRQFRKDGEETAAVKGHNLNSIHICLDGNFDAEFPTIDQLNSLKELLLKKCAEYDIPYTEIYPHRKYAGKTCYGSKLSDTWARDLILISSLPEACKPEREEIEALKEEVKTWKGAFEYIASVLWKR